MPFNCQPEHPESGSIPDAGVEVPDEEESGDVAAHDASRGELHRVREAFVAGQRVEQEARVAVRHFTLGGEFGVPHEYVRVLVGGQDHLRVEGHAPHVGGVLERPARRVLTISR